MSKEKAMNVIHDFEEMERPSPWIQMRDRRKKVAAQLRDRGNNPFLINQGTSGTCGPAVIVFEMARANPLDYVIAVTKLYNLGSALVRKWALKPCTDLLKASCQASIAEADWIIVASIRDSENWFFDLESERDKFASGTKLGEIEDWFKKAGYSDVKKNEIYINVRMNTIPNLRESLKLYDNEYQVIWFICVACIDSGIPDSINPNHFVALAGTFSPPVNESDPVSIPIFTWGQKITLPRQGGLKYGQFLDQYYGYVAGKF